MLLLMFLHINCIATFDKFIISTIESENVIEIKIHICIIGHYITNIITATNMIRTNPIMLDVSSNET